MDGTLHDLSRGWLGLSGKPERRETSAIMDLWLKCDDPGIIAQAKEILRRYAEIRMYDEALTYGVLRRQSTRTRDGEQ